jgi:hypothetical protein
VKFLSLLNVDQLIVVNDNLLHCFFNTNVSIMIVMAEYTAVLNGVWMFFCCFSDAGRRLLLLHRPDPAVPPREYFLYMSLSRSAVTSYHYCASVPFAFSFVCKQSKRALGVPASFNPLFSFLIHAKVCHDHIIPLFFSISKFIF